MRLRHSDDTLLEGFVSCKSPIAPQSAATASPTGHGLTADGSDALQTSSNWSILKPSVRTRVTNVVNLRPKTTIFRKNAVGLTTFVTSAGKSAQKAARIDDVCNNTRRATHQRPSPTGVEGAGGTGGPGCGARGRWRGLAGLRDRPLRAAGSRVAISRAGRRPRAHQAARPNKAHEAPETPVAPNNDYDSSDSLRGSRRDRPR